MMIEKFVPEINGKVEIPKDWIVVSAINQPGRGVVVYLPDSFRETEDTTGAIEKFVPEIDGKEPVVPSNWIVVKAVRVPGKGVHVTLAFEPVAPVVPTKEVPMGEEIGIPSPEELKKMSLKELSVLASDLALDPKDYRNKADLIDAIEAERP